MGRAKIASGGADGLYTVTVDYGKAERDARAARLTAAIAALNPVIAQAQAAYAAAEQEKVDAQAAADAAINVWAAAQQANPAQDHQALAKTAQEAVEAVVRAEGRLAPLRMALEESLARQAGLQLELNALMAAQVEATLAGVWCVDLTEAAAVGADVGTVEVPGEPQSVLLVPGCAAPGPADGALAARELMSPEQVFFNAAILPGWQKFYPTYRKGTLTAVDVEADTATVELDAAVSSAQNLPVNQSGVLTDVPVVYMTCNAAVFEPGDRVVVQFLGQNWDAPRVIGFAQWPKACEKFELLYGDTSGAWVVSGDAVQEVYKGEDGTTVCAAPRPPTAFTYWVWRGWSDGVSSQCRTDLDVQASLTVQALAVGFPQFISFDLLIEDFEGIGGGLSANGTTSGVPFGAVGVGVTTLSSNPDCNGSPTVVGMHVSLQELYIFNGWSDPDFSCTLKTGDVLYTTPYPVVGDQAIQGESIYFTSGVFSHVVTDARAYDVPCDGGWARTVGDGRAVSTGMTSGIWDYLGLTSSLTVTHLSTGLTLAYSRDADGIFTPAL